MALRGRLIADAEVSQTTLERTPERVLRFLYGISSRPTVRALLATRGYDSAEHTRGWRLLETVAGRLVDEEMADEKVEAAVAELDNWDEPHIRLIRAGLTRFPQIREKVLQGIAPVSGPGAVLNVATILDRLSALEATPDGKAALETLAKRGIDAAERSRLANLVRTAKSARPDAAGDKPTDNEAYDKSVLELRAWFEEWSEIARLLIKRRDHLIRLGLAERRAGDATDPELDVVDPTPFVTEPTPTPTGT